MLLDLINVAMQTDLEKLVTELYAGVQGEAIKATQKLDFFEQGRVPDFGKARDGETYDLVIMVKTFHQEWTDY